MDMNDADHLRIGILGGTFDPIHLGHLRIAVDMVEDLALNKILFIPAANPPHKERDPIASFQHRFRMIQLAIQNTPFFEVLDLEAKRPGLSYSIVTLKELHEFYGKGCAFYFILGIDAFLEIRTWKDHRELFQYAHFVVINRPGFQVDVIESLIFSPDFGFKMEKNDRHSYRHPSGHLLIEKEATMMDISSTRIRALSESGRSIRFLVPGPVENYIEEKGLYRSDGNG